MNLQNIAGLRKYMSITDHKPGCISLKFAMQILSDAAAMEIINQSKGIPVPKAILKTKLNLFLRTLVVRYDMDAIDADELNEIITTTDRLRFNELIVKYTDILGLSSV